MRIITLLSIVLVMAACAPPNKLVKEEYGIGVKNDGTLDTRAITVKLAGGEYSYGGVTPGDFKLHVGGLYLEEGKEYPPIEFHYGLMDEYPKERVMKIEWDGIPIPKGFKPPGKYPALMIVIYPGVDGIAPKVIWKE